MRVRYEELNLEQKVFALIIAILVGLMIYGGVAQNDVWSRLLMFPFLVLGLSTTCRWFIQRL